MDTCEQIDLISFLYIFCIYVCQWACDGHVPLYNSSLSRIYIKAKDNWKPKEIFIIKQSPISLMVEFNMAEVAVFIDIY